MTGQVDIATLEIMLKALETLPEAKLSHALQTAIYDDASDDGELCEASSGVLFPRRDFDFCGVINGVRMKRHPNGGGLVPVDQDRGNPNKAYVADDAYVGHQAVVHGTAKLFGGSFYNARVDGGMFYGGTFHGGTFRGGTFHGGTFNGGTFRDGWFYGGTFHSGTFNGGTFHGGTFRGGMFRGGMFDGGTFRGGMFYGGTFYGGTFDGGWFHGGTFRDGTFRDGRFNVHDACYRKPGKTYRSHDDADIA